MGPRIKGKLTVRPHLAKRLRPEGLVGHFVPITSWLEGVRHGLHSDHIAEADRGIVIRANLTAQGYITLAKKPFG